MRTIWRRIVLGARWSQEQGSHPGTPLLLMFGVLGAITGAERGAWTSPLAGERIETATHSSSKHGDDETLVVTLRHH